MKSRILTTKKVGFSLAEMMVVMLLIAVVLVASAPMVTRKMTRDRGTDKIFDMLGSDPRNAVEYIKGRNQRIFMNAKNDGYVGIVETGVEIPKNSVIFGNASVNPASSDFVGVGFNTSVATNSVAIGYNAKAAKNSVAIGQVNTDNSHGAIAVGYNVNMERNSSQSIAVGYNSKIASYSSGSIAVGYNVKIDANTSDAIAVGKGASVGSRSSQSVAIGLSANVDNNSENSIAIGTAAKIKNGANKSIVIGVNSSTTADNTVVIGSDISLEHSDRGVLASDKLSKYGVVGGNRVYIGNEDTVVYIPGHLVVGGNTLLGERGEGYRTFLSHKTHGKNNWHIKSIEVNKNANDDFRWGEDVDALMNSSRRVNLRQDYDGNSSSRQQGSSNSTSRSDIRLKNVGEIYAESLDALSKLNFYHFTFKDDKSKEPQVGVMAQDLQKVFPNSVKADRNGWLTIRWDEMFFAAINAIKELNAKISDIVLDITSLKTSYQEQQATIKSQAEIIETLQKEIASLNDRVEKLENSK